MRDRRLRPFACEDEARDALVAAVGQFGAAPGPACLSVRWDRSGADGLLLMSPAPARVKWLSLADVAAGDGPAGEGPADDGPADDGPADDGPAGAGGRTQSRVARLAEWRLHRDIYRRRDDVAAIVRSRPVFSTALACMPSIQKAGLPMFHPDLAQAGGGAIRCAQSAPPGSAGLSDHVLAALDGAVACLLAGRGLLVTGASLQAATQLSAELEVLAQIHVQVLQMRGPPPGDLSRRR